MIDDDGRIHHDVVAALGQAVIAAVADTGLSAASIVRTVDTETTALVWASDERARALSELTATLGEGPGVTALREGTPVFATDLRQEPWAHRWVTFAREAQAAQVGSIIAVPLQIGVVRVGLLQLHGEGPATVAASLVAGILRPSDSLALALLTPQGTTPP